MGQSKTDVNKRLKRTNIRGKDYIDVAQRINGFWEVFPEGRIETSWLVMEPEWCVCQATVYNMGEVIAQGTAYEVKGASNINKTSYIENCETSAIGRALGIAGIGSTDSVASANEVQNAISQQVKPFNEPPKAKAWRNIQEFAKNTGLDANKIAESVKTREDFKDTDEYWNAIADEFSK